MQCVICFAQNDLFGVGSFLPGLLNSIFTIFTIWPTIVIMRPRVGGSGTIALQNNKRENVTEDEKRKKWWSISGEIVKLCYN